MPTAFSYLRFSSPEQAWGDSVRRQATLAERYADRHSLTLDRSLTLRDLGISAFRGRNARDGALCAFLEAVDRGLVPSGSYLLVESLDRLSRDRILEAQGLFLQLVQAGIIIVTLIDERAFSAASLNANPIDLIVSLVAMMRAHEDSCTKSSRIRAAWDAKRASASVSPMTGRCPSWLRFNRDNDRFEVLEERAAIVRRIYADKLSGLSTHTITRALNQASVPLFSLPTRPGRMWHRPFVAHLLSTPSVIGTLIPCKSDYIEGKLRLRPQPPVRDYYPAIIDQATWQRVAADRDANRELNAHRASVARTASVLARLAKCARCDAPMILTHGGGSNWRYLLCGRAYASAGCIRARVRYPEIENVFTQQIERVLATCPPIRLTAPARREQLSAISAQLRHLRRDRATMIADVTVLRATRRATPAALLAVETRMSELQNERLSVRASTPRLPNAVLQARLQDAIAAAVLLPFDVGRLNLALRAVLGSVTIDSDNARLVLYWLHGGASTVSYCPDGLRVRARKATTADRGIIEHGQLVPKHRTTRQRRGAMPMADTRQCCSSHGASAK